VLPPVSALSRRVGRGLGVRQFAQKLAQAVENFKKYGAGASVEIKAAGPA
jgi:hypothetical protein